MNKSLLRSKMALHSDTLRTLSAFLGMTYSTLSEKINGRAEVSQSQIMMIKERYSLTPVEIDDIFFTNEVS